MVGKFMIHIYLSRFMVGLKDFFMFCSLVFLTKTTCKEASTTSI